MPPLTTARRPQGPWVSVLFSVAIAALSLDSVASAQITSSNQQVWYPSPPSLDPPGGLNEVAAFGWSVASGDFNGDGHLDLAIGSALDSPAGPSEGSVHVIYGTSDGLSSTYHSQLYQSQPGFPGDIGDDLLGYALASGDFNGDGIEDLAIAAAGENYGSVIGAGAVTIIYGVYGLGLVGINHQVIHQEVLGISDFAEQQDNFGLHLAAGDFDNDGRDDLVISAPYEDVIGIYNTGAVHVVYGSEDGLDPLSQQFLHAHSFGISLTPHAEFGWDVAIGHFNADPYADVAITFFSGTTPRPAHGGGVLVIYGNPYGVGSWSSSQILPRIAFTLTAGDFVGDGRDDLALGHLHDIKIHAGASSGLSTTAAQTIAIDLVPAPHAALITGDYDGNGRDDLAVGTPFSDLGGSLENAGQVRVYYGISSGGLLPSPQTWHQNTGVWDISEAGDKFGWALATGDFRGDGADDLVIGAPLDGAFGLDGVGLVHVLNGLP